MSDLAPYRIALIGVGKIARDQHLPALDSHPRFDLVAVADPVAPTANTPAFTSLDALLGDGLALDAVSICTPPAGRAALVRTALDAGLHVMLEKPPAATLSQIEMMRAHADARGVTLFASWHSREAGAVAPAREWLRNKRIEAFSIAWREDIRRWHPGQDWILGAGGYGVFDPGINALSIATAILPEALAVMAASMVVPAGRQSPLSARLELACGSATGIAEFEFEEANAQRWDIAVTTNAGTLTIRQGGRVLECDGSVETFADAEYRRLYDNFARLIARSVCDVDTSPSRLVADAFLIAERTIGPAFAW